MSMLKEQTYVSWTCYLCDDFSSDDSLALLHQASSLDDRIVVISSPSLNRNLGPAVIRNHLLQFSSAPYISFCDIDDLWHPQKLYLQLQFHISHNLQLSVTSYSRFVSNKCGSCRILGSSTPPESLTYQTLLRTNSIPMLCTIINRDCLKVRFPNIKHEDYSLWLRLFSSKTPPRYGCLKLPLAYYRVHSENLTSNKAKMAFWVYAVFRSVGHSRRHSVVMTLIWSVHKIPSIIDGALSIFSSKTYPSQTLMMQLLRER